MNKELDKLETSLHTAIALLESGGSIFVISFHSLEDKIVKNIFRDASRWYKKDPIYGQIETQKILQTQTKKPIIPTEKETQQNKRSRSAKARMAIKI